MPKQALVPIGELARRAGVATSALRYYERLGLLSPAELGNQGRRYTPESAERVALVRLCQDVGFTLAEIGQLLDAWSRGPQGWRQLAEHKIAELDARIADAQRAKELIQHGLSCSHRDLFTCPDFHSALEDRLNAASPQSP
jgi:DNA-binding transcriptional MerR regulator